MKDPNEAAGIVSMLAWFILAIMAGIALHGKFYALALLAGLLSLGLAVLSGAFIVVVGMRDAG